MVNLADFSHAQWNQVKAALRLWQLTAKHAKIHPRYNPKLQEFFVHTAPLEDDHLDALMRDVIPTRDNLNISTKDLAEALGWTVNRVRANLIRKGIKEVARKGPTKLYCYTEVLEALK